MNSNATTGTRYGIFELGDATVDLDYLAASYPDSVSNLLRVGLKLRCRAVANSAEIRHKEASAKKGATVTPETVKTARQAATTQYLNGIVSGRVKPGRPRTGDKALLFGLAFRKAREILSQQGRWPSGKKTVDINGEQMSQCDLASRYLEKHRDELIRLLPSTSTYDADTF